MFETVKTTTQKIGEEEVEDRVASFFFSTADQKAILTDTARWEQEDDLSNTLPVQSVDDILTNCKLVPNPVTNMLNIDYDLLQDASISFSLHDAAGMAKIPPTIIQRKAGHYTEHLQMSSFTNGVYILYVTVNGLVKTLHVLKK